PRINNPCVLVPSSTLSRSGVETEGLVVAATLRHWLLLLQPPPRLPLFPCTTLFRSASSTSSTWPWRWTSTTRSRCSSPAARTYTDRKSTRLNSSHVKISYDVFCLKKKKMIVDTASGGGNGDRKSTRLHSSHAKISYA